MSGTCRRLKAPCSGWLTLKLPVLRNVSFWIIQPSYPLSKESTSICHDECCRFSVQGFRNGEQTSRADRISFCVFVWKEADSQMIWQVRVSRNTLSGTRNAFVKGKCYTAWKRRHSKTEKHRKHKGRIRKRLKLIKLELLGRKIIKKKKYAALQNLIIMHKLAAGLYSSLTQNPSNTMLLRRFNRF